MNMNLLVENYGLDKIRIILDFFENRKKNPIYLECLKTELETYIKNDSIDEKTHFEKIKVNTRGTQMFATSLKYPSKFLLKYILEMKLEMI